jgi:large subunit ribosomal protein L18
LITAKEKGIKEAILDIGYQKSIPGSRLFAVLKGVIDNGLSVPHSDDILPKEDRILGKHIADYANKLKEKQEDYDKKFSSYKKNNADPAQMTQLAEEMKKKIIGA